MSSAPRIAALLLVAGTTRLAAQQFIRQSDAELRLRVGRLDSLIAEERRTADALQQQFFERHRAHLVRQGSVAVVWWQSVPAEVAEHATAVADTLVTAFGGIPRSFVSGVVAVEVNATDTARVLRSPDAAARQPFQLGVGYSDDTTDLGLRVAESIGGAYVRGLDTLWREWLNEGIRMTWQRDREAQWALERLSAPMDRRGDECLAAHLRACRQWLGLDSTTTPFVSRYGVAELRTRLGGSYWSRQDPEAAACLNSSEQACESVFERHPMLPAIPADPMMRMSVLEALRTLHSPDALHRVLVDSTGSIADRLARASGMSTDNFLTEWRAWTLSRGRLERVSASLGDTLLVGFFVSLMVFGATRTGRWV